MKIIACILFLGMGCIFAGAQAIEVEVPVYDQQGHLTSYVYTDGGRDLYTYDVNWRLTAFVAKDGKVTRYLYKSDGTMQTFAGK